MADTSPTLAITGATGQLGGAVARALADTGVALRILARTPERVPALPGADIAQAEYGDAPAVQRGLSGIDTVFMVSATESPDRLDQHRRFIDAAVAAGVRQIVYTSFVGAAQDATFTFARDHWATEEYLLATGLDITILRDSFYMDAAEHFAGEDGVIRGPAGEGRCAFISRADVARVATAILRDPREHVDSTYELTGPEALSFSDVAAILATHFGTPFSFHNETIPEAYESRLAWDAPQWEYDAWVSTYTAIAAEEMSEVSTDVESITGTAPVSLAEFLRAEH